MSFAPILDQLITVVLILCQTYRFAVKLREVQFSDFE